MLPNLSTLHANFPTTIVTRILHSRSWLFKRWTTLLSGLGIRKTIIALYYPLGNVFSGGYSIIHLLKYVM